MSDRENNKGLIHSCLAVFLTCAAVVAFYFLMKNGSAVVRFISGIFHDLPAVWIGIALAFILNPIVTGGERLMSRKIKPQAAKAIMIAVVLLAFILIVAIGIGNLAPELVKTVENLADEFPTLEKDFKECFSWLKTYNSEIYKSVESSMDSLVEWINKNLFSAVGSVTQSLVGFASSLVDVFFGIVFFIYVSLGKDRFIGQMKKLLYAVCPREDVRAWVLDVAAQTNRIFSGYISGKVLDSFVIGVIMIVCLFILRIPYAALIGVIIGVTRIIPMFGPIIGTVPCALLLLFANPWQCLIFLILDIVIQQIDGNIISPRILGVYTGLAPFWVLLAVLLFGKLMGFAGMVIGVPIFATIYYIIKKITNASLEKQGLPTESIKYRDPDLIEEDIRQTKKEQEKRE